MFQKTRTAKPNEANSDAAKITQDLIAPDIDAVLAQAEAALAADKAQKAAAKAKKKADCNCCGCW